MGSVGHIFCKYFGLLWQLISCSISPIHCLEFCTRGLSHPTLNIKRKVYATEEISGFITSWNYVTVCSSCWEFYQLSLRSLFRIDDGDSSVCSSGRLVIKLLNMFAYSELLTLTGVQNLKLKAILSLRYGCQMKDEIIIVDDSCCLYCVNLGRVAVVLYIMLSPKFQQNNPHPQDAKIEEWTS